jgi:hypothetical protein
MSARFFCVHCRSREAMSQQTWRSLTKTVIVTLKSSSTPTLPTFDQPPSMDDDSTMDITSVSPDMHLGESEALNILNPPPPEKQEVDINQGPPPTTSSVAFIGINYAPDSADSQMSSHRLPLHPTPWESVALQSVDGNAVTGHSSFPPTPCVVSTCL